MSGEYSFRLVEFKDLAEKTKEQCHKNITALVNLGLDPKKARFKCHINYEKKVIHALFSEYFMEFAREAANHGDIRRVVEIFQKKCSGNNKISLKILSKGIIAIGEYGPSLLILIINRAVKKIRETLVNENKELRQLKKDIRASFRRINCCKNVSVKIHRKKDKKTEKEIIVAQIRLSLDEKEHAIIMSQKKIGLLKRVKFVSFSPNKIISEVNKFTQSFL